jgi:energy-converting hydrogenase Eha subunit B
VGVQGSVRLEFGAVLLFSVVCLACAVAAIGLWRGARYGYATAITVLTINALGDLFNVISGTEPKAIIGIPIVVLILAYLSSRRRRFFTTPAQRIYSLDASQRIETPLLR